jgi:hypothetical protein
MRRYKILEIKLARFVLVLNIKMQFSKPNLIGSDFKITCDFLNFYRAMICKYYATTPHPKPCLRKWGGGIG